MGHPYCELWLKRRAFPDGRPGLTEGLFPGIRVLMCMCFTLDSGNLCWAGCALGDWVRACGEVRGGSATPMGDGGRARPVATW